MDEVQEVTAQGDNKKFFDYHFCHFFLLMIIFSFLGAILENCFRAVDRGFINSSNHFFTATFTYGIIIFLLYAGLGTPDKMHFFGIKMFRKPTRLNKVLSNVIYCLILAAAVTIGESAVGLINYYVSHAVIWEYNAIPWNMKFFGCPYAFTSVPTTVGFTIIGYLFMKFLFARIMRLLERVPVKTSIILCAVFGTLIIGDYIHTLIYTQIYGHTPMYWQVDFKNEPRFFVNKNIYAR